MNLTQMIMTQNETLITILNCIFAFFEALYIFQFMKQILGKNLSNIKKCLYILIITLTSILTNILIPNSIGDIVTLFCLVLCTIGIFKENIKTTLKGIIFVYMSIFVSGFLIQLLANIYIPQNSILSIPLYRIIFWIPVYSILWIIYIIYRKRLNIFQSLKKISKTLLTLNLLLGIFAIFLQTFIFSFYTNLSLHIKLLIFIPLLLYFIISIYSLFRTQKLEQTTIELENEKSYNKTLILLHDNIRGFKHDFNNIVQALGGYISLNDMNGLKEYYKHLLEDCKQTNNLNILNPETINNPSIYSLLTNKYYLATEKGIKMTFNIFTDLSKINFNIYEFTRILGILLDNAIEASQETEEKIINIEFKSDSKKQLFIISNSCKDSNISTTKIFEKGYSTKERNSGIGLWKVHTILSKNTNADLFTTVNNNMFTQQLEVFYV